MQGCLPPFCCISADGSEITCFALPVKFRAGGILLCVLRGVFSEEALIQALSGEDPTNLLGPSKLLEVPLVEEASQDQSSWLPGGAWSEVYFIPDCFKGGLVHILSRG